MVNAYIALGSNLGDRQALISKAIEYLGNRAGVVTRRAPVYETAPVGGPRDQPAYLNTVIELQTYHSPEVLLRILLDIEKELGRVRTVIDGPRTLDLDLLLMGDEIREGPELILPHPRLHQRLFVLEPLAELVPGLVHPRLKRTVSQLRAELLGVQPFGPYPGRELAGLRALVTGSTSGIGRAIALELASAGADVIIHGRSSMSAAREIADCVKHLGGRSAVFLADLERVDGLDVFIDQAWNHWNALDILINNAGADTLTGEAAKWPFEQKLEVLWHVDVRATMLLARAIGKRMKQAGSGVILNMGWDQAETGMEGDSGELFAATKGAIMSFSRSLALSLAPQVRVHCLAPGWIRTSWGNQASGIWQERVRRETPLGIWGEPEDVARTARWLLSPASAYLHGQIIRINGGAVR